MIPFTPDQTVCELGGGDKPLFHPNIDIRPGPAVDVVANIEDGIPLLDSSMDGVFSQYLLEHISWRKIKSVINEIHRVLKVDGRTFNIIPNTLAQCQTVANGNHNNPSELLFGSQDYGDNSHKTAFSPDSITQLFKDAGFTDIIVIPHPNCNTDMIIEAVKTSNPAKLVKLNLGSFTVMWGMGWVNIDITPLQNWAAGRGFCFLQHDLTKGIPSPDGSVDLITQSHFLEHLTYAEGETLLKECYRVMKPGAVMRIAVPDAGLLTNCYQHHCMQRFDDINEECKSTPYQIRKLWALLLEGHKAMYDYWMLEDILIKIGFKVDRVKPGESHSQVILDDTKDLFTEHSVFLEATK